MTDFTALLDAVTSLRPFDELSLEEKLFAMARVGADLNEMAIEVGLSEDELKTTYRELLLRAYSRGHFELRQAQHTEAIYKGNQTMLKHLGASRLKQIDALMASQPDVFTALDQTDLKKLSKAELILMLEEKLKLLKE